MIIRDNETKIQRDIEKIITNGVGFKDSTKFFSIELPLIENLVDLRKYLCVMEQNVSLLKIEDYARFRKARNYLCALNDTFQYELYNQRFDTTTHKGIEDALKNRAKGVMAAFNKRIKTKVA